MPLQTQDEPVDHTGRFGFSLIELLVVILIIGILLSVAIPLYLSVVRGAGDKTVAKNMKIIATAAIAYRTRHGEWPYRKTNGNGSGDPEIRALFIGPDKDLAAVPVTPGVLYSWGQNQWNDSADRGVGGGNRVGVAGDFVVRAKEVEGQDIFGSPETEEKGYYNVTTGTWIGINEAPRPSGGGGGNAGGGGNTGGGNAGGGGNTGGGNTGGGNTGGGNSGGGGGGRR